MSTRAAAVNRGLYLGRFTIAWNLLEAIVALVSGAVAGSIALIGFALDSLIEVSSGGVLLWRLHSDGDEHSREAIEQHALKLVGLSLLALAVYLTWESAFSLVRREGPEMSLPGIALAIASLGCDAARSRAASGRWRLRLGARPCRPIRGRPTSAPASPPFC